MIRPVRTGLLKLRTTRLPLVRLATAARLTALVTILEAARGGSGHMAPPPLNSTAGPTSVLSGTGFAMLMAAVFGVTVASGEFRHGTGTATVTPQHGRGNAQSSSGTHAVEAAAIQISSVRSRPASTTRDPRARTAALRAAAMGESTTLRAGPETVMGVSRSSGLAGDVPRRVLTLQGHGQVRQHRTVGGGSADPGQRPQAGIRPRGSERADQRLRITRQIGGYTRGCNPLVAEDRAWLVGVAATER